MNPTRVFDFIEYQQHVSPLKESIGVRKNGKNYFYSTQEIIDLSAKVARGLYALGLRPGDKVATVINSNRPEFTIMDIGMMQIGVANVPLYPNISSREYEYIFNDAKVKYCFIGDDDKGSILTKVKKTKESVPSLLNIYLFDKTPNEPYWEDFFSDTYSDEVKKIKDGIQENDLATIIYTSGTTGEPKGVMLSHLNIVSNVKAVMSRIPLKIGETALSFLPLNHVFERVCSYAMMYCMGSVVFTGIENLGGETGDLKMVKPHFFTCVPRLLEKIYERIYNKGLELKGIKRALFFWALKLTNEHEYDQKYTGLAGIKRKIADKLIFSKWREALGGNVRGIVVGASPCPVKIMRTFEYAGIPVREGYGLTESSPGLSICSFDPGMAKMGTVGTVLDGVTVVIDDSDGNYKPGEGEIIACGDNIMLGYYQKQDKTDESIKVKDFKRWLYTGDIGKFVEHNGHQFLKITDRKKELFKTSGGKYVAPSPIEGKLKESFLIEQAMVVGDNEKFVSALIIPAAEALKDWCSHNEITFTSVKEVIVLPKVLVKYQEIIDKYNPNFGHVEQVKKFALLPDSWEATKTDGSQAELTPTMKLKRRVILDKYKDIITGIYS
jgi:long-chain acyl-CoA synthetase